MFEDDDFDSMEHHNHVRQMPIYIKAEEISNLVYHLVKSVENTDINYKRKGEKKLMEYNLSYMMENSLIIPTKIMGAESVDAYDLKMENATIIRKSAREIINDLQGIEMLGFDEIEYLDLLRKEVENFRVLFAEWVKTFDPWDYTIDRWGLFNPPGINYDDHSPEDDIPFDSENIFEDFFDDYEDEDWEDLEDEDSETEEEQ
ncbi:hypothetical protein [Aequorivita xiaoshiensis]|uniref:Uncharacterized protein n=1 Tax=Aequorivita xiaoshiensis TaxID=2874476 RepID=A0A9X1QZN8_9FLAO|nr:hypothetical protein [Aequorivita xiaoshiensis]MCG2430848.1 hypothetical protein [Aequorivita xiaoshiensis]